MAHIKLVCLKIQQLHVVGLRAWDKKSLKVHDAIK